MQVGSYSYDMTKMLFKVTRLTFIQKQSIVLDYKIAIRNLRPEDQIFNAGALGNYSLAGFEMVSTLLILALPCFIWQQEVVKRVIKLPIRRISKALGIVYVTSTSLGKSLSNTFLQL